MKLPTATLTTIGLAGGFATSRATRKRPLGGVVWGAAGLACLPAWRRAGRARGVLLGASYVGALGASHPLAKKMGAWASVTVVSAVMALLSWVLADRQVQ